MLATVTLNGIPFAAVLVSDPFEGIQWLTMQRMIRGGLHTYAIETLDGFVFHTL